MKRPAFTACLLMLAMTIPTASLAGGGLLQSLPKDGSWTKYYVEGRFGDEESTATMTIKSVGRVMENGKACRWIEIEATRNEKGKVLRGVTKLLFYEEHLKPDFKKIPEIIRGWSKFAGGTEVKELRAFQKDPNDINGALWFLFAPNRKDVKKLKATKTIDFQKGQLKVSEKTSSRTEIGPRRNAPPKRGVKSNIVQTLWPHKTVPFGTAAVEWEVSRKSEDKVIGPKMTMKLTLLDYGVGAKSALPDKN